MESREGSNLPPWMFSGKFPIDPLSDDDIAWLLSVETRELMGQGTVPMTINMHSPNTPHSFSLAPASGANFGSPAPLTDTDTYTYAPPYNGESYYSCTPEFPSPAQNVAPPSHSHSSSGEWDKGGHPTKSFQCSICKKLFSRRSRVQACENNHRGIKEFRCDGSCGDSNCNRAYVTSTSLIRHCLPQDKRYTACEFCGMNFTKQNVTRHRRNCSVSSPPSTR